MPEQLYSLFFSVFPFAVAGISFWSKRFFDDSIDGLDSWRNNYVSLLDAVAVHGLCEKCKKDKKDTCKRGTNRKEEILRTIENTKIHLTSIKKFSITWAFVTSFISLGYIVLWTIAEYEKWACAFVFWQYYYAIFFPLVLFLGCCVCFFLYKLQRGLYIYYRCCKHYCRELISLVKKEQEALSNVKMENI